VRGNCVDFGTMRSQSPVESRTKVLGFDCHKGR